MADRNIKSTNPNVSIPNNDNNASELHIQIHQLQKEFRQRNSSILQRIQRIQDGLLIIGPFLPLVGGVRSFAASVLKKDQSASAVVARKLGHNPHLTIAIYTTKPLTPTGHDSESQKRIDMLRREIMDWEEKLYVQLCRIRSHSNCFITIRMTPDSTQLDIQFLFPGHNFPS